MAGKLFPETYIGDSEDVCKKTPTAKIQHVPQRDIKLVNPPSADSESRDNLAGSAERKELMAFEGESHPGGEVYGKEAEKAPGNDPKEDGECSQPPQKPQFMSLLDFSWLQEKEEEEEEEEAAAAAHQDNAGSGLEDVSSQGACAKNAGCDAQEGLWPPPADNTEERLEHRVNEVSSIHSFEPDGKLTPGASVSRPDRPESSPVDHEGYYLCDEEALLRESSASTGYFPCYRTYVELPRYQPPGADGQPQGRGSSCDASVQCDGCLQEESPRREKRGAEANNNSKEVKIAAVLHGSSRGLPHSGTRPGSGGKKLEGPGSRHARPHGDGTQEAGRNQKEQEGPLKPRTPGSSPSRASARPGPAKEGPGPRNSSQLPLPPASVARKSPQKKKHRGVSAGEEQATLTELKPLLHDQRSLPPSPEEKTGPLTVCCYSTEAAGESSQVRPAKDRGKDRRQRASPVPSCASAPETASPPSEPRRPPSRLSIHSIMSWVWKIFRKPAQPQPSTSSCTEMGRRPLGSRLRLWLTQHTNRVHPEPP